MQNSFFINTLSPCIPLHSIGKRENILRSHVTKWTYRQGIGNFPSPGDQVVCVVKLFLIDGTEISPTQNKIIKYVYGRGRLIQGLELALSKSQKGQVFKVKISPSYGYGGRQDINLIPPFFSLIFDIKVVDIIKPDEETRSMIESFHEVKNLLEKADDELRKQNLKVSLQILKNAFQLCKRFQKPYSPIGSKIVVKMANIWIKHNDLNEALRVLQEHQSTDDYHFIRAKCKLKILKLMGSPEKMMHQMKDKYHQFRYDKEIREEIEKYFKKNNFSDISQESSEETQKNQDPTRQHKGLQKKETFQIGIKVPQIQK